MSANPSLLSLPRAIIRARAAPVRLPIRRFGSSVPFNEESEERRKARERAWYLSDPTSSSSQDPASLSGQTRPPKPRFTTFDPQRTTTSTANTNATILPLPETAPRYCKALHAFLTTRPELVLPHSVRFLHPPSSSFSQDPDSIEVIRPSVSPLSFAGQGKGGEEGWSGRYDWIVIAEVTGRGKGIVARAERALRLWLHDNPIPPLNTPRSRTTKLDLDTDWALVPVGGTDSRLAVNLFTEEGLLRWDLESLWAPSAPPQRDMS